MIIHIMCMYLYTIDVIWWVLYIIYIYAYVYIISPNTCGSPPTGPPRHLGESFYFASSLLPLFVLFDVVFGGVGFPKLSALPLFQAC